MKEFKSFILREDVQKFIALGVIVLIIALLHDLISVLLLTAIIGYLAVKAANRVSRFDENSLWLFRLNRLLISDFRICVRHDLHRANFD